MRSRDVREREHTHLSHLCRHSENHDDDEGGDRTEQRNLYTDSNSRCSSNFFNCCYCLKLFLSYSNTEMSSIETGKECTTITGGSSGCEGTMGAATGAAGAKAQREQQKRNNIPTEFLSLMISKVSYRGRQKSDKGSNSREGETPAATGAADR